MESRETNHYGFLVSLNLMLMGGILLATTLIPLNRLITHYTSDYWESLRGMMATENEQEAESYMITSGGELFLNWLVFIASAIGLFFVIHKLVKAWKN